LYAADLHSLWPDEQVVSLVEAFPADVYPLFLVYLKGKDLVNFARASRAALAVRGVQA
jgi:hypothetical protein